MKIVAIVLLMSAQCVSPVQQSQGITEAAKVQCAALVETDADTGSWKITPEAAAADQRVLAAIARLKAQAAAAREPTVVPVAAPPTMSGEQAAPSRTDAQPDPAGQSLLCKGGAKPRWYTAQNGRRKYRCAI